MGGVKGWSCWEELKDTYEIGIDEDVKHVGQRSGYVTKKNGLGRYGAIMQKVSAEEYRGKRVRFSAYVKCRGVTERCGLFMEVFDRQIDIKASLQASDSMYNRPISGTQDWQEHAIVLDVSFDSFGINIGARLFGPGTMWIDGVSFEEVGKDVPSTDELNARKYPARPQNLSFEDL